MTINDLLTSYGNIMPIDTPAGVSDAIEWFYIVEVFTMENPDLVTNGNSVIFACEENARTTEVNSTDYNSVNNKMYHVRCMIDANIQVHQ